MNSIFFGWYDGIWVLNGFDRYVDIIEYYRYYIDLDIIGMSMYFPQKNLTFPQHFPIGFCKDLWILRGTKNRRFFLIPSDPILS